MNISLNIPVSGLQSVSIRQDVTAHSIANCNTPSFTPKQTQASELKDGGTYVSSITPSPGSDLTSQMTDLVQNKGMYSANAKVIKVEDRMLGELLDMVG
jgi:flagellar hook protein FlgE